MKKVLTIIFILNLSFFVVAQTSSITGTVNDESSGVPLVGASIQVKNTGVGTVSDSNGAYTLNIAPGAHIVVFSYVGYADAEEAVTLSTDQKITLNVSLSEGTLLDAIVVSSSKKPEKLTESPATIETLHAREIESYAGNPAELLARLKGVDYFRAGVIGSGINIRGYNNNFNSKNLQVTDGRISGLIATGLPYGPLNTTIKEDIERMEVILGPNATMYGPNAHNGLVNIITKDPRRSAGTTIALNAGNQKMLSARLRHAQVLSDQFAFKIVGEYSKGEEFEYTDSIYINRDTFPGNEGYAEIGADPAFEFLRTEASFIYSPSKKTDITASWGRSKSSYLSPTNVGRNRIEDWVINYYQLRLSTDHFFAQFVYDQSTTDSTFSIDSRSKAYYGAIDAGATHEVALANSFPKGTLFTDASKRISAEAQYNTSFGKLDFITGVQYRKDMANSKATYLLDGGESINQSQYGAYAHFTYKMNGGWRIIAAARADYHEVYEFNFVPKLGIVKVGDVGSWRLTYGKGIAAPTIFNLEADVFGGLLLGNAEGFTLIDGSKVDLQRVEKLQTIELGYRGQLAKNKVFFDANVYYNISEDFLSPFTIVGVATHRGDTPIEEVQALYAVWGGLVGTYVNFGKFNTYGFDMGLNYYFNDNFSTSFNYSYFGYSIDEKDLDNDFTKDGIVDFRDLLPNAPNHKANIAFNYFGDKFFGSAFFRWVQAYDYFSGFQIASQTHEGLTWRGVPIVEGARGADAFNYGPLGGFTTVDLNLGYKINDMFTIGASVSNLLDTEQKEFTASPPTGRLFGVEFKVNLGAIEPK